MCPTASNHSLDPVGRMEALLCDSASLCAPARNVFFTPSFNLGVRQTPIRAARSRAPVRRGRKLEPFHTEVGMSFIFNDMNRTSAFYIAELGLGPAREVRHTGCHWAKAEAEIGSVSHGSRNVVYFHRHRGSC